MLTPVAVVTMTSFRYRGSVDEPRRRSTHVIGLRNDAELCCPARTGRRLPQLRDHGCGGGVHDGREMIPLSLDVEIRVVVARCHTEYPPCDVSGTHLQVRAGQFTGFVSQVSRRG